MRRAIKRDSARSHSVIIFYSTKSSTDADDTAVFLHGVDAPPHAPTADESDVMEFTLNESNAEQSMELTSRVLTAATNYGNQPMGLTRAQSTATNYGSQPMELTRAQSTATNYGSQPMELTRTQSTATNYGSQPMELTRAAITPAKSIYNDSATEGGDLTAAFLCTLKQPPTNESMDITDVNDEEQQVTATSPVTTDFTAQSRSEAARRDISLLSAANATEYDTTRLRNSTILQSTVS